jgi:hypothetical protein
MFLTPLVDNDFMIILFIAKNYSGFQAMVFMAANLAVLDV